MIATSALVTGSNSRLSFAVPKASTRFEAEICIDDAAEEQGSAVFRVLTQTAGRKPELKELYRSEVLRGGGDSKSISVDLTGADSLILLVEAADHGDAGDLADVGSRLARLRFLKDLGCGTFTKDLFFARGSNVPDSLFSNDGLSLRTQILR